MADRHIIPSEESQPEFRAWANSECDFAMLSIDKPFLHVSASLTRAQTARLIAALQDAEQELAAREVERVPA